MCRFHFVYSGLAVLVVAIGLYGCSGSPTSEPAGSPQSTDGAQAKSEHGDHQHADDRDHEDMAMVKENLAKLSDADRAAVEKQKNCPVSDEMLGAMDVPIKVRVKGQDVWLCCENCEEKLTKEPDKYLAKLKK